jgi:hypothetical protein
LIHRQISNLNKNEFDVTTVSIDTDDGLLVDYTNYKSEYIPYRKYEQLFIRILHPKIRRIVFGITGVDKIYRSIKIFIYLLNNIHRFDVIIIHNYPLSGIWLSKLRNLLKIKSKLIYYYHSSHIDEFMKVYPGINKYDGVVTISGEKPNSLKTPTINIVNNYLNVLIGFQ